MTLTVPESLLSETGPRIIGDSVQIGSTIVKRLCIDAARFMQKRNGDGLITRLAIDNQFQFTANLCTAHILMYITRHHRR